MTPDQLRAILPKCRDLQVWCKAVDAAASRFGINTPIRLAAFLAQTGHESAQFGVLRENLSYSAKGILLTWPGRFYGEAEASRYARQPERLANRVYAGRLGNINPGDGWRYRGGGLIQLTGRANYRAAGEAIGVPLEDAPGKIEQPDVAALAAAWYWQSHGCNALADAGDFVRITETINGPAKLGLAERTELFLTAKQVLKA